MCMWVVARNDEVFFVDVANVFGCGGVKSVG